MTGNRYFRRHQLGMQTILFLAVETAVDRMSRLTGWNASGTGYKGGVMPFMEFSDRDPIPKWDFQEPGARLKPWLRELSFLATRH